MTLFEVSSLAFLYSYKCNFQCAHCSVNSGPWHSEILPIGVIERVLDEAYHISSIKVVVATGGEPTLFPRHLEMLTKKASSLSFITRIVTNAWWASSYENAKRLLEHWRALGLEELNVSYDSFHEPFLKKYGGFENIINAVRAGVELGLRVVISTVRDRQSSITTSIIRNRLKEEGLESKVYLMEDFISPTSRAKDLEVVENVGGIGCADAGTAISIHPNGDVAFCCGHIINDPDSGWFTRVGNIYRESLAEIIRKIYSNILIWYIHVKGPHRMVQELNPEEKVYRPCHACHLLATKYWNQLIKYADRKEEWGKELTEWIRKELWEIVMSKYKYGAEN